MATIITPATLTVTLTEAVTLGGEAQGATNTLSVSSVTEVMKRIVNVPITEVEILAFAATNPAAGSFVEADVRYIRITNLDDTNHVTQTFKNEAADEFAVKLFDGFEGVGEQENRGVIFLPFFKYIKESFRHFA